MGGKCVIYVVRHGQTDLNKEGRLQGDKVCN
ncbi:histidine phosphatase family protein [Paenibacillus psychroresistens]|nr:histidine phosphatase family protein [Paenibacillus psychroresistens]